MTKEKLKELNLNVMTALLLCVLVYLATKAGLIDFLLWVVK
jgi:hypothetical protein